ncbi:hypothetical protein [Burkholderia gladioli]|jgi:hypothetical protein|uniref:hypothetical protein n=1 Tax=Burkholderia gladioli TaxID=28095 RepID=UPI0016404322|nr:hypothetical protein [Burkholderia gladioli]
MNAVIREFIKAAREAPRLFFLPLTGAIEAVRRELGHSRCDRHPNAQANASSHNGVQDRR